MPEANAPHREPVEAHPVEGDAGAAGGGPRSHMARWAVALGCAFLPAAASACAGGSWWLVIATLGLPAVGVVLGLMAGRRRGAEVDPQAKALARRAVGLNVALLALVGVMLGLLSQVGKPKERAQRVKCASNLRQIGQGLLLYTNERGPAYPPTLEQLFEVGAIGPEVCVCPTLGHDKAPGATTREIVRNFTANPKHCSYVYVGGATSADAPADVVVAYEPLTNHGGAGSNILYNDGHVEWVERVRAEQIIAELRAGRNPPHKTADAGR